MCLHHRSTARTISIDGTTKIIDAHLSRADKLADHAIAKFEKFRKKNK